MKYQCLSDPVFSVHRSDSFTRHKAPLHPATAASVSGTITQLCSIRPEGLSAFWRDLTENQIILWLPFFGNTVLFPFIQTGNNKKNFLLRPLSLFGIVSLSHAFCTSSCEWLKCKSMHRLWLRTLYTSGCYSMRVAASISEWMHFKTPTSDKSRGLFYFFIYFFSTRSLLWSDSATTPLQDFLQGARQSADTENAVLECIHTASIWTQSRFLSRFSRFFSV